MTDENKSKESINIGLVQRLFDQLEKAMSKVDEGMSSLSQAIVDMLDILKHSTSNDVIISKITETNRKVEPTLGEVARIYEKCKVHTEDVKNINKHLSKLSNWVKTMIIVVLVTFSLLTISYYFTRSSIEGMVKKEFNSSEVRNNEEADSRVKKYEELKIQLDEIRKELIRHKTKGEALE